MIVEVTDKNLEVARIARITDIKSNHLRIHFEGWPDDDDIWCLPDCPDIHPPSWHKQNQKKLEPPRGICICMHIYMLSARIAPRSESIKN